MADTDATPMTDGDIIPPPATTEFEPAAPLKAAGVGFDAPEGGALEVETQGKVAEARTAIQDGAARLGQQATDRVRSFAVDGKARAGDALDRLSQMLGDAASQVDDRLGGQYGEYARSAAGAVSNLSTTIRDKDVDELFDDARGFIRKSPAVAIGGAAAVGFVLARLIQSGLEADKAAADIDRPA